MASETARLDVVFDGGCGFCTRAVEWLERLDRRNRIRAHPFQRAGVLERFGLSEEAAHAAVWAVRREAAGAPAAAYRGAAAVSVALDTALGLRLFASLYRTPGIGWMQERAYHWVAEHRHRLRGVTPWCEAHPEDCGLRISTD